MYVCTYVCMYVCTRVNPDMIETAEPSGLLIPHAPERQLMRRQTILMCLNQEDPLRNNRWT